MAELETRKMGRTGMTPAALGLGGAWWHQVSEEETIAGIHRALELGFTYLDTYRVSTPPTRARDRTRSAGAKPLPAAAASRFTCRSR